MYNESDLDFVVEDDMFSEDEYMRNVNDHAAVEAYAVQRNLLRYKEVEDEFSWF